MSAADDIRDGMAEAFDALATEFVPSATVKLLKQSLTTDAFTEIRTVSSKRFFEYSNFRKNTLLRIADTSSQLTLDIQAATHVSIDSVVYVINQGDTLPPSGTNPIWQMFLVLYEPQSHYATL